MTTQEQRFRLRTFGLLAFLLLLAIVALFLWPKLRERGDRYWIDFRNTSVNGLNVGATVKYQGVEIGSVARIEVNPVDLNSILVTVEVDRTFRVKRDMSATMQYAGITGLKFIELRGGLVDSPELHRGGQIATGRGLGERAEDIVTNIDSAVRNLNAVLDKENQDRLSLFLENTARSAEILSGVLADKKQNLESAIVNLEASSLKFQEITQHLADVSKNLSEITAVVQTDTEKTLANITKRFSDEELGQVLRNLEVFISTATTSMRKIETGLVQQQEDLMKTFLFINQAIENFSRFSRELIEDPTLFIRMRKEKGK